jgi:hypothetical protein
MPLSNALWPSPSTGGGAFETLVGSPAAVTAYGEYFQDALYLYIFVNGAVRQIAWVS